ncbi:MAG TPA: AAA family ATPase [Candidatus Sabulitectum sp.]|nr:AAA family ATPase [Candidatus Sabulitectum sp.]HPJ29554.1 AAA family ATPase [Candidatus Sabulitectum sp.]HPR22373.1 AAA family ATPase [Candidatus Sabulitectum sp.]
MGRVAEVIIASGIPGAGKSTWIRKNTNPWMTEVFSADSFFMDRSGRYRFDPERLAEAHARCLRAFTERLIELAGCPDDSCPVTLAVDNTNICSWEIAPYYSLSTAYGIPVRIVRLKADAALAHSRNIHGVEREKVEKMYTRLCENPLPGFWNVIEVDDWT